MIKFSNTVPGMSDALSIIAGTIMALCSCGHSPQASESNPFPEGKYTFIRVYQTRAADHTLSDSTILRFDIRNDALVSGTYRWVLPEKDGKYGTITGRLSNDTIFGKYNYMQEGGRYTDSVQIVLGKNSAIVTQFTGNYPLNDTLIQK